MCYECESQFTNIHGRRHLCTNTKTNMIAFATQEEEEEGSKCNLCEQYQYNETPYFTPQISPSPSLMSFFSCTSSFDTGDIHANFAWNERVGEGEGEGEDGDGDGDPYHSESSVDKAQSHSESESDVWEKGHDSSCSSMEQCKDKGTTQTNKAHVHVRVDVENNQFDCQGQGEIHGDLKSSIRERSAPDVKKTLGIDIHNNASLFVPPEPEEDYDKCSSSMLEEEDDEEEGLPLSSDMQLSFRSNGKYKKEKKETMGEAHRMNMKAVVDGHFRFLVDQLVAAENMDKDVEMWKWKDIICSLSWEAASLIKADASSEGKSMDPGGYVKVKCVACGQPSESEVIKGVVFKKNVAHKHMPTRYKNPRLLLLGGALEYERASNHLSSFDTLLQQEIYYLHMAVEKIEAHRPNVLLVEKTVSRHAQECLLAKEISLVLDVKKSHLERIAQCTGAQIVSSLDNLTPPNVKHCELFHVEKFVEEHGSAGEACRKLTKTLMFLEGCPKPLGFTILLKGASGDELKKVKRVVQYAVFAAYHLALETSFLVDERARLLETSFHSAASLGKLNKQVSLETSICTGPGFAIPVLGGAHVGELQKQKKDDTCMTISPLLSNNSLNCIEEEFKSNSPTGLSKTTKCVRMPSARDVCPTNEMMHQKATNVAYDGFTLSSVSSCHLMSGLSASLEKALGKPLPHIATGSYAATNSYLDIKGTEFNDLSQGDLSTLSVTSRDDDCGMISEVASGKVQLNNEGLTEIQDDSSSLESQPKIEHKNQGSNHYEEQGFSKERLTASVSEHKSILVSLSSRCILKGTVCEHSRLLRIKYYGSCDMSLGRFLHDRLFDQNSHCHACDQSPTTHAYCYTHHQGRLIISVQQLPSDLVLPGKQEGKIWMWHRCLRCTWKDGIPQGNRRIVMSDAASGLSFGKFLELSFLNHAAASRVANCGHSLHRDCLRFYGLGNMVTCFQYSAISVFGVWLPPPKIEFNDPNQQDWLRKEVAEVTEKGEELFSEILDLIHQIRLKMTSGSYPGLILLELRNISKIEGMLQKEREEFEESLQKAITKNWQPGNPAADILELNRIRWKLLFESYVWDYRLRHLHSSIEVEKSSVSSVSNIQEDRNISLEKENIALENQESYMANNHDCVVSGTKILEVHSDGCAGNCEHIGIEKEKLGGEKMIARTIMQFRSIPVSLQNSNLVDQLTELSRVDDTPVDLIVNGKDPVRDFSPSGQDMTCQAAIHKCITRMKISGNQSVVVVGRRDDSDLLEDLEVHRLISEGHSCDVSDLSNTFNFAWIGDHLLATQSAHVALNGQGAANGDSTNENSDEDTELNFKTVSNSAQQSLAQSMVRSESCSSCLNIQVKDGLKVAHPNMPSLPVKSFDVLKDFESLIWHPFLHLYMIFSKASEEFLSKLISWYTPVFLKSAFKLLDQGGARLFLPTGVDNTVIPVYDDEPTTLIAYALSSKQYWAQISDDPLEEKKREKYEDMQREAGDSTGTDKVVLRSLQFCDSFSEVPEVASERRSSSSQYASTSGSHETAYTDPLLNTKVINAEICFGDENQFGKVKYSVICYHAKQFSALRKICCSTEKEFISSMSRCKKWGAEGGKSKVFFAKTLDDRFIIKQVTKIELESFLKFAPAYFKHLMDSLSTGSPTCLAKVLGIYQVTLKHSKGGKDVKMDLMVMENLLFGKTVTQLYDLKGSLRNRYNPDSSGVHLDQNFIEAMLTSPIFVGNKAKHHLERAVWNDTSFLDSINVMDYSLLVGVDEEQRELVLGIIDYMRQYTWDKHLETWVKASGILGGPKNEPPTVISPYKYKKRFRKAISTYFQTVPDPWPPYLVSSQIKTGEDDTQESI